LCRIETRRKTLSFLDCCALTLMLDVRSHAMTAGCYPVRALR
jgi:hypothetical protein